MEIAVRELPKFMRSLSFSPRTILSDVYNIDFLIQTKEYMFGMKCCEAAKKIKIDLFDLVFINDKPFCDCFESFGKKQKESDIEVLKTAFLLKKMQSGDHVRIAKVIINGDIATLTEPEYTYLSVHESESGKKRTKEKIEKLSQKKVGLNKRATIILESIRLAALRYTMQKCVSNKELIDNYNYRRFSTDLRLNNRPAELEEINAAMSLRKHRFDADFSKDKTRINFCVLYALAYGGYTMEDIYGKNTVFENNGRVKEKRLSDLSSELMTILYNGNGIEISSMMINMIVNYSRVKLPPVDLSDLNAMITNYSIYYAATNLAAVCENIFRLESDQNGEMKEYMKRHTFFNYWTVMDRLMFIKQYSTVVSFCYKLANFDVELYRNDPEYQGSILYSFESAEKFAEELKNNG